MNGANARRPLLWIAIVWLAIPVTDALVSLCVPRTVFAFRPWELARRRGRFESDFTFDGKASGDLSNIAHTARFRTDWHEVFRTDAKGRRITSPPPADDKWPVVVVGDSQTVGAGVSDGETMPALLEEPLGVPVLNYGGHSIWEYLGDEHFRRNPPRLVVWMFLDRAMLPNVMERVRRRDVEDADPTPTGYESNLFKSIHLHLKEKPTFSRWVSRRAFGELRWWSCRSLGPSVAAFHEPTGMLFYAPEVETFLRPEAEWDVDGVVAEIELVRDAVRETGSEFLFVVAPTKTTIYPERLPAELREQSPSRPLAAVVGDRLEEAGVPHVNLYAPFRASAEAELLMHPDDTHWNRAGNRLAAEEIARYLREERPDLLGP